MSDTPDFTTMFSGFARKGWGDHTALSVCLTADEQGDFEIAVVDECGELVWQPFRCNVNDPETERDWVASAVHEFYKEWQTERYGLVGEWREIER